MKNLEKLTICYNAWMIFGKNDDYDTLVGEIAERGFNCIRIEDGAGLLWDREGKPREKVPIASPFGKYTKYTTYNVMVEKEELNLLERLLRIFAAAKKHGVKVALSSWFFLHTNWFCREEDKDWLFAMSDEEKISFFSDALSRILDLLRERGYIDLVAFAEIFNEFDGLPFVGEYKAISEEAANRFRLLHEAELARLKKRHPDVLFAFDTWTPGVRDELIPRNIDVLNFHWYYAWPLYEVFQKEVIQWSLEEPEIPAETAYFLKKERISVADIAGEMGKLRTGLEWPRRISLYSSVDPEKEGELTALLDRELRDNLDHYLTRLHRGVDTICETHRRVVPHSKLVMGEGNTYCASPTLAFERDSETFWNMISLQMEYLRDKGLWGSVITTHAPGRTAAWGPRKESYRAANRIFLGK